MPDADKIELFTTFEEAHRASAYDLARRWVDDPASSLAHRNDPAVQIDELATMAALAEWLSSWMPATIHRALLAGASLTEVAAAAGVRNQQAAWLWECWSDRQLQLSLGNPAEHARVASMLVAGALEGEKKQSTEHVSKRAACERCGGDGEYVDGIKDPFWRHCDARSLAQPHAFVPKVPDEAIGTAPQDEWYRDTHGIEL